MGGEPPAIGIAKFKEYSRDRYILAEEFPRFWRALDVTKSDNAREFFYLILMTGRVGRM
jgi:hypothetical protein